MEKKRIYLFDNFKFILIFLVVLGHSLEIMINDKLKIPYTFIYLFHMPAFVFISGYFFKRKNKKIFNMIGKFIIFQILYLIFVNKAIKIFNINFLKRPYWILWYMYCLVIWNIVMNILKFGKKSGIVVIVITTLIGLFIGYIDYINMNYSLSRMIGFFPFFILGIYFRDFVNLDDFINKVKNKYLKLLVFTCFILLMLIVSFTLRNYKVDFLYISKSYYETYTNIFIRLIQYGIAFISIFTLLLVIPNKKYMFSFIGTRTEYIYLFHGFIIILLKEIFWEKNLLNFVYNGFFMRFCLCLIITIIIISFIVILELLLKNFFQLIINKVFKIH